MRTGKGERWTRCLRLASIVCFLLSIFGVNPVVAPVRALAQMPIQDGRGTAPVNEEEELETHHKSRAASQEWHRPNGKHSGETAGAASVPTGRRSALSLLTSSTHTQKLGAAIGSCRLRC